MIVLLTLTTAGSDTGPFDLYSNLDGYTIPFTINVSKSDLQAGYLAVVPDFTQIVRVKSTGICINFGDIVLESTTTTTTTSVPALPCNETVTSGGVGVTEYVLDLESIGGLVVFAMNAQSVPDKLEIIHDGVKKATTSMSTPNEGPFDDLYGDPTVPTNPQANSTIQFIGSSKGAIPDRQSTFASETGSSLVLPVGYQQLVWWEYTNTDYIINPEVVIRITGPGGTAWNLQRLCQPATTTTTTTGVTTLYSFMRDGSQNPLNPSFHIPSVDYIDSSGNPATFYADPDFDICGSFTAQSIVNINYCISC